MKYTLLHFLSIFPPFHSPFVRFLDAPNHKPLQPPLEPFPLVAAFTSFITMLRSRRARSKVIRAMINDIRSGNSPLQSPLTPTRGLSSYLRGPSSHFSQAGLPPSFTLLSPAVSHDCAPKFLACTPRNFFSSHRRSRQMIFFFFSPIPTRSLHARCI